jgi:hypothetical protein
MEPAPAFFLRMVGSERRERAGITLDDLRNTWRRHTGIDRAVPSAFVLKSKF